MKTLQIDVKSVAIGVILGLCLLIFVAAQDQKTNDSAPQYCIATSNENTYIIDARTGDTWRVFERFPTVSGNPMTYSWAYAGKPSK